MNAFELVIYAIVAVAIIAVLGFLFAPYFTPEPISDLLQKNLTKAQSNLYLGKTIDFGPKNIPAQTTLQKNTFESTELSFAFECNNPKVCCETTQNAPKSTCTLPITWDYQNISFRESEQTNVSLRCIRVDDFPVCRAYFGQTPAQAKLSSIQIESKTGSSIAILVTIKNDGKSNSIPLTNTLRLEKMVNYEWADTGQTFTAKETNLLTPNQTQDLLWNIDVSTSGKYRAVFRAEGTNAGFDENSLTFDVGTNELCTIDQTTPTDTRLADDGNYMEFHYCTGCNYSYECATAWTNKNPSVVYEPNTKDDTYCMKSSSGGAC